MSYLAASPRKTTPEASADFDCGWSVVSLLAGLSLHSDEATPSRATPFAARRAAPVVDDQSQVVVITKIAV